MQQFSAIITSFPAIIYTILLGVVIIYWFIAALGLLDIHTLDGDLSGDIHAGDVSTLPGVDIHASGGSELHHLHAADTEGLTGLSGLLLKLGLNGVPITVVITCLVLYGWLACYFIMLLASPLIGTNGWLPFVLGIPVFLGTFIVSIPASAQTIKPLRNIFAITQTQTTQSLIGKTGVVRTSKITASFGEAEFEDGGAGLILKVRADEPNTFKRGDRVVLFEYSESKHTYTVIPEQDLYQSTVE